MYTLLEKSLFDGELVRLGPIDHEKDPEIEARWTHDASFMRLMYLEPMRPLAVFQVKKKYEDQEKEADEQHRLFPFRIRAREDDRLVGLAEIYGIMWSNGTAQIRLGIGSADDRCKGYGREALSMVLGFAFGELNLYRLTALIPEYNLVALNLFKRAGFVQEVCRRKAVNRDGRFWDLCHYGLLADDWRAQQPNAGLDERSL